MFGEGPFSSTPFSQVFWVIVSAGSFGFFFEESSWTGGYREMVGGFTG